MSITNNEQDPNKNSLDSNAETVFVPHSGVHNDEKPEKEFDKTPLHVAVEQGLINSTPDSVEDLARVEDNAPNRRKNKLGIIFGSLLGITAVIGGGVAIAGNNEKPSANSSSVPSNESGQTSSDTSEDSAQSEDSEEKDSPQSSESGSQDNPEVKIANSDSPQDIASALDHNYTAAINTSDTKFLDFFYSDESYWRLSEEAIANVRQRKDSNSGYRLEVISEVASFEFFKDRTPNLLQLKLNVDQRDISHEFPNGEVAGKSNKYTETLVLKQVERTITLKNGQTKTVSPWLVYDVITTSKVTTTDL